MSTAWISFPYGGTKWTEPARIFGPFDRRIGLAELRTFPNPSGSYARLDSSERSRLPIQTENRHVLSPPERTLRPLVAGTDL